MNTYICPRCGQASTIPKRRLLSNCLKVKIARLICGASALFILGVVGGLECFWLPLWPGTLWLAISFVVFAISARKGGLLNVRR